MIKTLVVLSLVLFLAVGIYLSCGLIYQRTNEAAENNALKIILLLDEFYRREKAYPPEISSFLAKSNIGLDKKIYKIISVPKIRYELGTDRKWYKIFYYEFPLGPFHVYNSQTTEWYYEE